MLLLDDHAGGQVLVGRSGGVGGDDGLGGAVVVEAADLFDQTFGELGGAGAVAGRAEFVAALAIRAGFVEGRGLVR